MKIALVGNADNSHMMKWSNVLFEMGYEHDIYTPIAPTRSNNFKAPLYISSSNRRLDLFYYMRLARVLRSYDIINIHMPLFKAILLFLLPRNRVSINILGSEIIYFPKKYPLLGLYLKKVFQRCREIIVPNNYLCSEIRQFLEQDKPVLRIIYGIDTATFKYLPKKRNSKQFRIIIPKEIKYVYGTDILIKAFLMIQTKCPQAELFITGKMPLSRELRELINSSPYKENIHLTGWVANIHELISSCHVTVLPSRSESFGVAAIESILLGTPVIAHNTGGLTEILETTEGGILIDNNEPEEFADAIEDMMAHYDTWTSRMNNASVKAKQMFSQEQQKQEISSLWLRY